MIDSEISLLITSYIFLWFFEKQEVTFLKAMWLNLVHYLHAFSSDKPADRDIDESRLEAVSYKEKNPYQTIMISNLIHVFSLKILITSFFLKPQI